MAKELSLARITRLRFIDFLLDNYDKVNRSHIADYFGLSVPQASLDLQLYMAQAPDNMTFCKKRLCYVKTDKYVRVWK